MYLEEETWLRFNYQLIKIDEMQYSKQNDEIDGD